MALGVSEAADAFGGAVQHVHLISREVSQGLIERILSVDERRFRRQIFEPLGVFTQGGFAACFHIFDDHGRCRQGLGVDRFYLLMDSIFGPDSS